ncbi:hypothetical protein Fmac_004883 [Flemingia macrophylla]|uniref:Uncharacterized protein n=1 Tax=Flemingia macrophylla TaxID=520843 RepID=A0ABD1N6H9_9FABA
MLATFISSTALPPDSWRLCTRSNATPFQAFVVDRLGHAVYVTFSDVHTAAASDNN